jgi:cell division septal protein FtsQ
VPARNLRIPVIAGGVLLFSTATYLLAWSPVFVVKDIEITGAPTSDSSKAISKALAITTGEKLARVEPRSLQRRLDSFDWISDVNISRDWINRKVSIEISSRTPIALFNPDTSLQTTIDTTGKVFRLPGGAPNSLPRVQAATPESGVAAIDLFTELPESFRSEITLMNVRSSGSFEVSYSYKSRQIQIAWGDGKESALKVEVASKLLALPENSKIRFIDVSAPYAPIVR